MLFRNQKALRAGDWKYLSIEGNDFLFQPREGSAGARELLQARTEAPRRDACTLPLLGKRRCRSTRTRRIQCPPRRPISSRLQLGGARAVPDPFAVQALLTTCSLSASPNRYSAPEVESMPMLDTNLV